MPMSQVATDNFNRANEAPLSDGGNWSAGYLGGGTGLAVVSDACEQGATTAINSAIWTGYAWPSDHYSEFSFTNTLTTYSAYLVVRMQKNAGVWSAYAMLLGSTQWHEQFDSAILLKLCYEHFYRAHYHALQFCRDAFIHRCLEISSTGKHAYRLPKRNFGVDCDRHKPYRRNSGDCYKRGTKFKSQNNFVERRRERSCYRRRRSRFQKFCE